jgi:hypothetical protein
MTRGGGFRENSEERVNWGGQCEAPCGASERLQCAQDAEDGVGEVRGKEEGEGRKKHGPACVQHRAHSS